jgi:hypothetical protein
VHTVQFYDTHVAHDGASGFRRPGAAWRPERWVFTAFWNSNGGVSAAMHANDWDTTTALRAIVEADHVDLARLIALSR